MLKRLLLLLALLISACDSLSSATNCPDGQPPQTIQISYTATIEGKTVESDGQIGAEMRSGDKTILTLLTADNMKLQITLYRDPAAGENFAFDTSASYENERDAGIWVSGENPDGSLIGGGIGSVSITNVSANSISGEFSVTIYNANVPPMTIESAFANVPLAACS